MTLRNLGSKMIQSSGRSRGGAQGACAPPLFLEQIEAPKKIFWEKKRSKLNTPVQSKETTREKKTEELRTQIN